MAEYRLDDLAQLSGVSARNIRAYRERGLLDPPRRVGRSAYYGEPHLAQLKAISQLLGKGFNSAHIAEFFNSLRDGRDLADILGIPRTALNRPAHRLQISSADDDARALVRLGLAEVVDDSLMLTDPALGELVAHADDQRLYVRTIVRVAESTGAAVDGVAALAVEALAECTAGAPERSCRELAQAVVAGSLDRALRRRTATD
ncbi:MerR family transcriptional regulator [Mycobacterium sp. 21AC1]|uniref:MerR family transcriptional regulator n=1 Tax=[Mycobacterium] appelbergii TaxID=2939269 RepID=UPI002938FDBA|nr:MerR family transcriptional regulator [Mycobacterium sp. 21AC1]MDV3127765.1 MerR family transcriptional regulator [Mycobacterium sp. 21AC1]